MSGVAVGGIGTEGELVVTLGEELLLDLLNVGRSEAPDFGEVNEA